MEAKKMSDDEKAQEAWGIHGLVVEGYSRIGNRVIKTEELDYLNQELDRKIKQEEFRDNIRKKIKKVQTANKNKVILILFGILLVGTFIYTIFLSVGIIKEVIVYFEAVKSDDVITQAITGLLLKGDLPNLVLFLIIFISELIAFLKHLDQPASS
jgi:hypothetical protein